MLAIDGCKAVFQGTNHCFWFDPDSRKNVYGAVVLKRRTPGFPGILFPMQYRMDSAGSVIRIPVVYFSIDMLSVQDIDLSRQTFEPTFYLDIRATDDISIKDILFVNLAEDQKEVFKRLKLIKVDGNIDIQKYRESKQYSWVKDASDKPDTEYFCKVDDKEKMDTLWKDYLSPDAIEAAYSDVIVVDN